MLKQWEHALDCEFLSRHDRIALRLTHTFILRYERTFKLNCSSPLRLHPQGQSSSPERMPRKKRQRGSWQDTQYLTCCLAVAAVAVVAAVEEVAAWVVYHFPKRLSLIGIHLVQMAWLILSSIDFD